MCDLCWLDTYCELCRVACGARVVCIEQSGATHAAGCLVLRAGNNVMLVARWTRMWSVPGVRVGRLARSGLAMGAAARQTLQSNYMNVEYRPT